MDELLEISIKASIKAGIEIMKVYDTDFDHELKEDASPLTLADRNANLVITSYLKQTNIPIISEENLQTDYAIRKEWSTCWIVDPLDGTKEFIKRNGEFTVNIALIENGKPVLGVVYVPVEQSLYFTHKYKAYKRKLTSVLEPVDNILNSAVGLTKRNTDSEVIRVVGSRSHMNDETKSFIENLSVDKEIEIVSKGSSLKFCLVAEGEADIYPRFAPTMEWDTAAAHAVCNAVGIKVTSLDSNEELKYNKENLLNPWFICK